MESASIALASAASCAMVFLLARSTARFTVVYRRNNLAAVLALVLFAIAVLTFGWWGVVAFVAGTLIGAWEWAASIRRANENFARSRAAVPVLARSRRTRADIVAH